jgi:hypothetical protein
MITGINVGDVVIGKVASDAGNVAVVEFKVFNMLADPRESHIQWLLRGQHQDSAGGRLAWL